MQMNQVKDSIDRIEQCVDDAVSAARNTAAPDDLRQAIDRMHEQARQSKQMVQSSDETRMLGCVDDLEQLGDRAVQACRKAGGNVDPQLQSAVQRAHDEISSLKKQMH
jgi:hypothetical protein